MGLDMYLFRISKLNNEDIQEVDKMSAQDLDESGYFVVTWNEGDERNDNLLRYVKPYMHFVKRDQSYINMLSLKEACGVPENARKTGEAWGEVNHELWFRDENNKQYKVELNTFLQDSGNRKKVVETHQDNIGVCKKWEVAYWRKAYDLRDALHLHSEVPIENCGYYVLNHDMIEDIVKDRPDLEEELKQGDTEDSGIFYHEWY